jgi:hypothetical protein
VLRGEEAVTWIPRASCQAKKSFWGEEGCRVASWWVAGWWVVAFRRVEKAVGGKFERPMWWVRFRGMREVMWVQVARRLESLILL